MKTLAKFVVGAAVIVSTVTVPASGAFASKGGGNPSLSAAHPAAPDHAVPEPKTLRGDPHDPDGFRFSDFDDNHHIIYVLFFDELPPGL